MDLFRLIWRGAERAAMVALTTGLVASGGSASAASIHVDEAVIGSGGVAIWDPENDQGVCDAAGSGYSPVEDGARGYDSDAIVSRDAFDSGLLIDVGATTFKDGDDRLTLGPGLVAGPETVSGLRVTTIARGLPTSPTLQYLVKLQNRGTKRKVRNVELNSDLGSDGDTGIRASSSGDLTFTKGDRWVVTSDHASTPSDPVVTHVLYGRRAGERVVEVIEAPGNCLSVRFRVAIPGRSVRYLLFFAEMNGSNESGVAGAAKFNKPRRALLAGLGPSIRTRVLNWDLA